MHYRLYFWSRSSTEGHCGCFVWVQADASANLVVEAAVTAEAPEFSIAESVAGVSIHPFPAGLSDSGSELR